MTDLAPRFYADSDACVRHSAPGCPSCLKYALNDARAALERSEAKRAKLMELISNALEHQMSGISKRILRNALAEDANEAP